MTKPSSKNSLISYLETAPFPLPLGVELDKTAKRFSKDESARKMAGPKINVYVLSSFLTDFLLDHLVFMLARRGFNATVTAAEYGVIGAALLDKTHQLHKSQPDVILILPSFRDLAHCPPLGSSLDEAHAAVSKEVAVWGCLWKNLAAPAVQMTFDTPSTRQLSELDGLTPGGLTHHIRTVNLALPVGAPSSVTFIDADTLTQNIGQILWNDAYLYQLCKQPFSMTALPFIADAFAAQVASLLGRSRRVLVLDLDNTLWGGVIGDDGLANIELGPETPEGEAFTAFQIYATQLRKRGVILAVCSKNDIDIALLPFREHPSMVIKESDIACFVANFSDKPTNIRVIADNLNLGLETMVFVDDNPVERELMRRELPQVLTVEMPDNPAIYVAALDACNAFPLTAMTHDDISRADSYFARNQTQAIMTTTSDIDGFLQSLNPKMYVEPIRLANQARIQQLIAKTNQFKLNPKIFNVDELTEGTFEVLAVRLTDRLQDYGIVSVAVLAPDHNGSKDVIIKNWVMSCRVFSRRLEFAVFEEIFRLAKHKGAVKIKLTYTPSGRNHLIADLLEKIGFEPLPNSKIFSHSIDVCEGAIIQENHYMETFYL